jgi:hypothetical protein
VPVLKMIQVCEIIITLASIMYNVHNIMLGASAVIVLPLLTTVSYGRFFYQIPRLRSVFGFSHHCT